MGGEVEKSGGRREEESGWRSGEESGGTEKLWHLVIIAAINALSLLSQSEHWSLLL